jgi:thiosulfate reductase cytochrome b subunit
MSTASTFPAEKQSSPSLRAGAKRKILRWIHLILTIPVLGYVYGSPAEVQQYATAVRFVFVPIILLSGFWMYAGALFAVLGVAVWLGAYRLLGSGAAILCEAGFIAAWRMGMMFRARRSR